MVSANVRALPPARQRLTDPRAMHGYFVAGAVLSLLAWWLGQDMPLTPQQMTQYLLARSGTLSFGFSNER